MSTDLRAALRDAVATAPIDRSDPFDVRELLDLGSERVRRRNGRVATVATSVLAAAAVAVAFLLLPGPGRRESGPLPAHIVHLDLDGAAPLDLDVLATQRSLTTSADDPSYDRFAALTPDGLAVRDRYTYANRQHRIGLVGWVDGSTQWLPRPPGTLNRPLVAAATVDQLVLFDRDTRAVLVFDRRTRQWARAIISLPRGLEVHVPPRLRLGPDGRLYLGANEENQLPLHWWSYALPGGGAARPEPDLEDVAVTWSTNARVTASPRGRVVLTEGGVSHPLAVHRPASCPMPEYPFPPLLELAGDQPVVTYWCGEESVPQNVTVVLGQAGQPNIEVRGMVQAAHAGWVLLVSGPDEPAGTYLLDLATRTVRRLGPAPHDLLSEPHVDLAAGLVMWNSTGPRESRKATDVVWKVARLP